MSHIPVQNVYFLLCYAWNRLEERDSVNVSTTNCEHVLDLLSRVLCTGTTHLLKQGLHRDYILHREDTRTIRGHFDVGASIKSGGLPQSIAVCEYDELSHNVLHNRILKTTISSLIGHPRLSAENEKQLVQLHRRLLAIDCVDLTSRCFAQVRIHRNNRFYGFLLSICKLIYENVLAKEGEGDYEFKDFIRDSAQMARLFEEFLRNFYRIELERRQQGCRVIGAERLHWYLDEEAPEAKPFLPTMLTDISIEWPDRYLIIDAKYYSQTFQKHYDKKTIHSANLNQLFTYVVQIEPRGEQYEGCEGMLLYPTVDEELNVEFSSRGHRMMVKTVNLAQDWEAINERLHEVVQPERMDRGGNVGR